MNKNHENPLNPACFCVVTTRVNISISFLSIVKMLC